jgi:hypothetical protein
MIAVALLFCLAVGVIVLRLYRDLANLRTQLKAARAQIDAQMVLRNDLRSKLQDSVRDRAPLGTPSIVGVEASQLLKELKIAEEKIRFASDYYHQVASTYLERLHHFPHSLIAVSFRLPKQDALELSLDPDAG